MNTSLTRLGLSALISAKALLAPVALGVCAFAQDKDGRILLVRHSYQPGWLLPGGGVDRGEHPDAAILRELKEEVRYLRSAPLEFVRLYTRKAGWATNVVALYRVAEIEIDFKPSLEIREAVFAAPDNLPEGTTLTTRHRIEEMLGQRTPTAYW